MVTCKVDKEEFRRLVQDEAMNLPDMNIAISGMAGRFPKADSVNEFEDHLYEGTDMVNDNDESRFPCRLFDLPPRAGRLKSLDKFDSQFFGYTLEEANYTDFHLRLLLEVVYESILDAGLNPASLRGSKTGLYMGFHANEFEVAVMHEKGFKTSGYFAQVATKVAQYFDFRGVTATYDTACSSSFIAFHCAAQALTDGSVERAIVCSANASVHPIGNLIFLRMQMLSPTGYSRFMDADADGYVKAEACVSILLEPKHLAMRNYSSIIATMTNSDGYKREGITFPSVQGQETLTRATKQLAGLSTNYVEYIEAHGTGTPAGDPQEATSIANVYVPDINTDDTNKNTREIHDERIIGPLLVGSVKTNMGHSEGVSGLCSVVKVAMMLENELIYKGLHFEKPSNQIKPLIEGKLKFTDTRTNLSAKVVPISCYGFGGANVHAILRANDRQGLEEPNFRDFQVSDLPRLILMFGRSEQTLNLFFNRILDTGNRQTRHCLSEDFLALLDAVNSRKIDRRMNYRGYLVVDLVSKRELARKIEKCELSPLTVEKRLQSSAAHNTDRPIHAQECSPRECHLVLPGIGSQWAGMASGLVGYEPFWSTIERLANILAPLKSEVDLVTMLTNPNPKVLSTLTSMFVGIVGYEIALVNMVRDQLKANNLRSAIGHSVGEISSAYAAGLIDEREAILVAYRLGRTLDEHKHLIEGKMVAISMSEKAANEHLKSMRLQTVRVACINGPESVTLSGSIKEINSVIESLKSEESIFMKQIECPIALHNEVVMTSSIRAKIKLVLHYVLDPAKDRTRRPSLTDAPTWRPNARLSSNDAMRRACAEYFADSMCKPVDFHAALDRLPDDSVLLELGPSKLFQSQLRMMRSSKGGKEAKFHYVGSMDDSTLPDDQPLKLVMSMGELYLAGVTFTQLTKFSNSGKPFEFPVRRQTPSLSSIFSWAHEHSMLIPSYPRYFSKSSAKSEVPIELVQERDQYLAGHCVDGRVLYPTTAYLFHIWRMFSFIKCQIYDSCLQMVEDHLIPIEFHNVRLLRAVILSTNATSRLYMHLEEATGHFEIVEGGGVVANGYVRSPTDSPTGLLYDHVRDRIKQESLELTLTSDDVYKQFRVSGYDYGETFRNIQDSSYDGRYCRVKFTGYYTTFADCVLQSLFLAISDYAPSGGLFLPTGIDYVRFQPDILLNKFREAGMMIDRSESQALEWTTRREVMAKIMERDQDVSKDASVNIPKETSEPSEQVVKETEKPKPLCLFDTYCDPKLGIVITDGFEIRGVHAAPAPRRMDNNEVVIESFQFIPDIEEPVEDEQLTKFHQNQKPYVQICDLISLKLMSKFLGVKTIFNSNEIPTQVMNGIDTSKDVKEYKPENGQVEAYLRRHLNNRYSRSISETEEKKDDTEAYDIKKNGDRTLISILDQLDWELAHDKQEDCSRVAKEIVQKNNHHLAHDLIQSPLRSERFLLPIIETVLENSLVTKNKLKLLEINQDDVIMKDFLELSILCLNPTAGLDFSLAHPDLDKLTKEKLLNTQMLSGGQVKTYTLKDDLNSLFLDNRLGDFDLIVYRDTSFSHSPEQLMKEKCLASILPALNKAARKGGFILLLTRYKLTVAERVLLSLCEPKLVGLSEKDFAKPHQQVALAACKKTDNLKLSVAEKIDSINSKLASRCRSMISEAGRNGMQCLARKSDQNGCLAVLFKTSENDYSRGEIEPTSSDSSTVSQSSNNANSEKSSNTERILLRVTYGDRKNLEDWMNELKKQFSSPDQEPNEDPNTEVGKNVSTSKAEAPKTQEQPGEVSGKPVKAEAVKKQEQQDNKTVVWLCAVITRQQPVSGLIGLIMVLKKEFGSARLRCFYDCRTFKDSDEPISVSQIEQSDMFQLALRRDVFWNCVDSRGKMGAFRHIPINDCLSYDECLCSKTYEPDLEDEQFEVSENMRQLDEKAEETTTTRGAYVNTAQRGDLSSFTWFETPYKYLDAHERMDLVRVAYSALNFRDIMLASGRLPPNAIPLRVATQDCLLGLEFSGIECISGKRVMGMVCGRGIATHVHCPKGGSIKLEIPDSLSLREAATIPVVYATAIMALIYRGRMKRGESILIHAGSGGVGQAAIRLALHHGLQVYTTVGTAEKRKFLLDEFPEHLSDDQIFNSRDCTFEDGIRCATRGRGVDLVLNSLADDKLQASVRCLADGGRFLEIGKYDMCTDSRLELLNLDINKSFHGILLDKIFETSEFSENFKNQVNCVQETLRKGLSEGFVRPIKHTMFKRNEIEQAFRFMATGKHMGKILIEIDRELETDSPKAVENSSLQRFGIKCVPRFQLSPVKSYIVTGGLGGFGLELTKWLVRNGARYLVLTSRTGPRIGYQKVIVKRIESSGVKVLVMDKNMADTTTEEGVERLVHLALEMSPNRQVGAIFHLAMVLKDSMLDKMSSDDFELVCKPKVNTCLYLDKVTRQMNLHLDFFVAFSSIVAGKGNIGQSNYGYANSCLERICEQRRQDSLHGLAIQFGYIGDVGAAYENVGGNDTVVAGTVPQRVPSCLSTLSKLLSSSFSTCSSFVPVNTAKFKHGMAEGDSAAIIMHVLGISDQSKVSDQAKLSELGLDSIMAVEIRQYIEREHGMTLNIQEIRSLTIAKIKEFDEARRQKKLTNPTDQSSSEVHQVDLKIERE